MNRLNEILEKELGPVEAAERILELEEALRPIVEQWEECEKLRVDSGEEEAEYISVPIENSAMLQAQEILK